MPYWTPTREAAVDAPVVNWMCERLPRVTVEEGVPPRTGRVGANSEQLHLVVTTLAAAAKSMRCPCGYSFVKSAVLGDFISCIHGPFSSRLLVMVRLRGWALMYVTR